MGLPSGDTVTAGHMEAVEAHETPSAQATGAPTDEQMCGAKAACSKAACSEAQSETCSAHTLAWPGCDARRLGHRTGLVEGQPANALVPVEIAQLPGRALCRAGQSPRDDAHDPSAHVTDSKPHGSDGLALEALVFPVAPHCCRVGAQPTPEPHDSHPAGHPNHAEALVAERAPD